MKKNNAVGNDYGIFDQGDLDLTRPVLGMDLDALRIKLGLSVRDATWLFGMNTKSWYDCTRHSDSKTSRVKGSSIDKYGACKPVDESLALLVRFINVMPECIDDIDFRGNTVMNLRNQMSCIGDRELSVLVGRNVSASHRWFRNDSKANPTVLRLCDFLAKWLSRSTDSLDHGILTRKIAIWRNVVYAEHAAREIFTSNEYVSKYPAGGQVCASLSLA